MSHRSDELEGFECLLSAAGRSFQHAEGAFRGIVKRLQPTEEAYDLTPTDDDTILVSAFRGEMPGEALKVGASFTDAEGFIYRVTRILRNPNTVIARFECVVTKP